MKWYKFAYLYKVIRKAITAYVEEETGFSGQVGVALDMGGPRIKIGKEKGKDTSILVALMMRVYTDCI